MTNQFLFTYFKLTLMYINDDSLETYVVLVAYS